MRIKGHFHTWKICVSGVFWKPFYEDDILPEIQVPPGCPQQWLSSV